jgi:hypothetical protein
VEVAVDLLVHRPDDRRVAVAEVLAGDAAAEVEVLAALRVPDAGAPGAADDEVGPRDAARHEALARVLHAIGGNAILDPHGLEYRTTGMRGKRVVSLRNAQPAG